ncbi:AAA family ATPase [Aestuariivirga sp.]|uniref:AAA family ATPase n=1 Tax=Aestuariivirga sp. TaxID=2650926 RepID=UPI0035B34B2A
MHRADPVIEFVGLPGSGKSTITRALPQAWPTSRNTDPPPLPLARRLQVYGAALPFMLSLRPLEAEDTTRLRRIAGELRFYERPAPGPLVIDQGMIQKLWSILLDRRSYSAAALQRLVAALAPSAPDLIVHLGTPPDVAAERLVSRNGGNSRLQKLPPDQMRKGLVAGEALYARLLGLYRRHAASRVLELSGADPVAESAARVMAAVEDLRAGAGMRPGMHDDGEFPHFAHSV